jgi:hypothetical protein
VLTAERASAPISALERLANCKVRRAGELMGQDPDKAAALLDQAEEALGHLLGTGETSERWSLLGGAMKRRAQLSTDAATRRKALRQMSAAYKKAYERSRETGAGDAAYPLGNHVAAEIVLSWGKGGEKTAKPTVAGLLRQLDDEASTLAGSRTDAFSLSAPADYMLLHALAERKLDEKTREAILSRFNSGLSRGATARQRDSIRTQLRFFQSLMLTEFPRPKREEMIQQLELLGKHLG